jgi:hypothetical protein
MSLNRSVVFIASTLCLLTVAAGQPAFQPAATTSCNAANRGTVNCPTYTAPATTAVPRASIDGSKVVPSQTSTTLFNGAIPPNGFMVLGNPNGTCFLNDNGPASGAGDVVAGGGFAGFQLTTAVFVTPPGYKPIGPVSIWCTAAGYVAARAW